LGVAMMSVLSAQGTVQSDRAFQAALQKEMVDGNLKGAIEDYRAIATRPGVSRALAAQALLRMAEIYQKLGDPQARTIYDQLVRDFADQKEPATAAKTHLAGFQVPGAASGPSLRRVLAGVEVSSVSPDERWAVFSDWNAAPNGVSGADLVLIDLRSGTRRVLDKHPGTGSYVESDAVFSPDGSQVAYHFAIEKPVNNHQIRIVPINGTAPPRIVYESLNADSQYVLIRGWTPDGRRLLISPQLKDKTWQLSMLSIADGTIQTLKSFGWAPLDADLSPDGRYVAYAVPVRDDDVTRDVFTLAVDGSQNVPLVQHPANDSDPVWSADGSRVLFLSDRTRTSSLWAVPVKDGRPAGAAVLVKDDITMSGQPMTRARALYYGVSREQVNVYHAALGSDGKAAGEPTIATNHDINNDCCAAVSPDGKRLAYYSRSPQVLVIRDLGTGAEQEYPLKLQINSRLSTVPAWFPDGRSLMVHGRVPQQGGNHQYRVDLTTGRAEAMRTDGITLQSRLAPDGKSIIAGSNNGLQWHDLTTQDVTPVTTGPDTRALGITISPDGKLIAYWQWREGKAGVSNIVVAERDGRNTRVLCRCEFPGAYFPLNALTWMPDQRHIVFADSSGTLWRVPVAGGEREQIGVSVPPRVLGLQVQPDSRGIYFTVRSDSPELWVLENFLEGKSVR
jgi:Tol biopolymer transport system component